MGVSFSMLVYYNKCVIRLRPTGGHIFHHLGPSLNSTDFIFLCLDKSNWFPFEGRARV